MTMRCSFCRGQPWGSPKTTTGIPLKTCKKSKTTHLSLKRTPTARPTPWWPSQPIGAAQSRAPSSGIRLARGSTASLERTPPRSRVHDLPRAGSASLEELPPPRSRLLHAHVRSRMRVRAFDALTTAGRRHHAPGNHAPALPHQLPRGTHPRYCGELCGVAGVSPVTPCRLLAYG
jgi:hypothetical protein